MRVLIHTPFFYPSLGGVETFTDTLAGALTGLGAAVRVIARTPLGGATELQRPFAITRPPYDRDAIVGTADVLLSVGPSTELLAAARRQGVPTVLSHQAPAGACPIGIGWRDGGRCAYRLTKCLGCNVSGQTAWSNVRGVARMHRLRAGMRLAAANIYISRSLAGTCNWCPGEVIGNCYDSSVFRPAVGVTRRESIIFVGRLVPIKGADVAIRGFALARRRGLGQRLTIVGDGPERAALERLAAAEGVAGGIDFAGPRKGSDLASLLQAAYVLVFPSQWEEPFGIVMAEAMGSGCPVVASGRGACPEVVGETGVLVRRHFDPEEWATAMLTLSAEPTRRDTLASMAADRAGKLYTREAVATSYLDVLQKAARKQEPLL